MTIWGLCPKCDDWFRADDWFDTSVPIPTCPSCGMSPSRISYGSQPPARGERAEKVRVR